MEKEEFKNLLSKETRKINIDLSNEQLEKFYLYFKLILEWNKKFNLTAITDPNDIIIKHFVDSLTASIHIKIGSSVVDCGTGAGFPGIPLAIVRNDCKLVLFDSLNKRITFIKEVIDNLELKNVVAIHSRAEDLAYNKEYREQFDYAISRAVANMSTLLEYLLPFCKTNGLAICMKGSNITEELENCKNSLKILNGKIEKRDNFVLPDSEYTRNIILVRKIGHIPQKFPRRQGKPAKEPLG